MLADGSGSAGAFGAALAGGAAFSAAGAFAAAALAGAGFAAAGFAAAGVASAGAAAAAAAFSARAAAIISATLIRPPAPAAFAGAAGFGFAAGAGFGLSATGGASAAGDSGTTSATGSVAALSPAEPSPPDFRPASAFRAAASISATDGLFFSSAMKTLPQPLSGTISTRQRRQFQSSAAFSTPQLTRGSVEPYEGAQNLVTIFTNAPLFYPKLLFCQLPLLGDVRWLRLVRRQLNPSNKPANHRWPKEAPPRHPCSCSFRLGASVSRLNYYASMLSPQVR